MNTSVLITDSGILLYHNGQHLTVSNDHHHIEQIKEALKNELYEEAILLMNARDAVKQYITDDERFTLENDLIVFEDRPFSEAVTDKVLRMLESGNRPKPLFQFLENVRANPSKAAQDELLLFCSANNFMITDDGYILAYKSVNGDYMDLHSGTIRNAVGDKVAMERNEVNDNRNVTCSDGLHFAAYEYASTWAGDIDGIHRRLMLMKVHPRDVVSIPADYANQKGRCCYYEVIDEITTGQALEHQEVFTLDSPKYDGRRDEVEKQITALEVAISNLHSEIDDMSIRHETAEHEPDVTDDENEESSALDDKLELLEIDLRDLETELYEIDSDL